MNLTSLRYRVERSLHRHEISLYGPKILPAQSQLSRIQRSIFLQPKQSRQDQIVNHTNVSIIFSAADTEAWMWQIAHAQLERRSLSSMTIFLLSMNGVTIQ
ncbi:MAG TPA: hypothetical protein VJP80_01650 [Candidatus Saccharimonadales bacterium]|uniref:hypothetical protein n=1 Tax=Burkholderia metallica TaxID=488729 RepID=UPI00131A982A|nr:hypothetical protein [Burkholderia metallica]HDR9504449.1 hypothetical protein [Burkholderia cepacia]HKU17955.1 hypothetical protein [Candidatus Saccharimonadales bacterium]